jgi:DNA-binding transcriptional LysR family regulator
MDLSQLHVFLTVAKEQSFSRAAEKLYRTQPAVSIVIRKLEESVGQPLLVRGARQVKLTDAGELLRDYAERLLNLRDEIQKGMEDLKSLGRGELTPGRERKLDPRAAAGARALQETLSRREAHHAPHAFARHPAGSPELSPGPGHRVLRAARSETGGRRNSPR